MEVFLESRRRRILKYGDDPYFLLFENLFESSIKNLHRELQAIRKGLFGMRGVSKKEAKNFREIMDPLNEEGVYPLSKPRLVGGFFETQFPNPKMYLNFLINRFKEAVSETSSPRRISQEYYNYFLYLDRIFDISESGVIEAQFGIAEQLDNEFEITHANLKQILSEWDHYEFPVRRGDPVGLDDLSSDLKGKDKDVYGPLRLSDLNDSVDVINSHMDSFDELYETILHHEFPDSKREGNGRRDIKKNHLASPLCGSKKRRGYNRKEWEDKPKQPSLDHDPGMWEGDEGRP